MLGYHEMTSGATRQLATTIGSNLRAARADLGLTQREVGAAVEASEMQVSKWERGQHRPSPGYEMRLADFLFEGDVSRLYEEKA